MVATKRRFNPNLQRVRVFLDGKATRAYVCARCLKGNKVQKAILEGLAKQSLCRQAALLAPRLCPQSRQ